MKILVTGNLGYIGTVLVPELIKKNYNVIGFDTGYFKDCILTDPFQTDIQILKDIRNIEISDLKNIDAVIHLAALSNDPLGELAKGITEKINYEAALKIAFLSKKAGVKRFVYVSSLSMYGVANTDDELDEDNSDKNPVTAYAKTKWMAECELKKIASKKFCITFMRPSTVFGVSPRLRCVVVFNNLVGCAFSTGKIEIKSDGKPWRPVVHVKDLCSALIAGLEAPEDLVNGRSFNVGVPNGNYTVKQIAEAAQKAVPGSQLIFTNEHIDSRSYKISFNRILTELKDYYKPKWNLNNGGKELFNFFKKINFNEEYFRGSNCTRLLKINQMLDEKQLNKELYFYENK